MRGDTSAALADLGRATDDFAAATGPPAPWAAFFGENDLAAMSGTVHVEIARSADIAHPCSAIPFLTAAVAGYGPDMARSRALTQILLALGHALDNDLDEADRVGARAIDAARTVRSVRPKDRLSPLETAVRDSRRGPDGERLLERITAFRRAPVLVENAVVGCELGIQAAGR